MPQEQRDITIKKQAQVPSTSLFEADAKLGLENMDQDDLALPFLKLLQNSSDETKKKHASYVNESSEDGRKISLLCLAFCLFSCLHEQSIITNSAAVKRLIGFIVNNV